MEPWKIILQNIQGLVTENTKRKIDFLKEYTKENKIIMINITETWLNDSIKDDAEIEGYKIFRCDRKERKHGGTAIYLYEKLEAELLCEISYEKCEMIAIRIPDIQTVNIVIYRPPKTKLQEFEHILNKIKDIFNKFDKPDPTIILSGDMNFPFVKWKRMPNNSCIWEYKSNTNATVDEKQQFEKLMDICNSKCLLQIIEEPTREENTLDLFYTNETSLTTMIEINKTKLSDHNLIEISTNYKINQQLEIDEVLEDANSILRSLNFHAKSIKWKEVNDCISAINWEETFRNKDTIKGSQEFEEVITNICIDKVPKRMKNQKSRIPKERKKLLNRIKMLKREKHRAYSKEKKKSIEMKILETEEKVLENRRLEKLQSEEKAIDCMKENPRMLYSYINKQRNRQKEIGPFKSGDEYIYDGKEICNSLKLQYVSQFSESSNRKNENLFDNHNQEDLTEIKVESRNIEDAIDELDENSSAGPDGLPAIFLKKTKETISKPLALLLRKSLDEGKIPEIYKLAYVTPIHKGGSKQKPENYRPVSLTSHVMKVFERVIKKSIMIHLIEKQNLNKGQHGFVPGRSTQTQLLAHYNDIYEALIEGKRVDTVFLDFAKAFDKVDHDILLEKVKLHKISGKLGKWIEEFLKDRKFRVVANGCMSDEENVISGVPQGTVLAAVLFVIMISDIDENIKSCIVRSFADDTRVNKKISSDEDKKNMQEDLESIYKWANENLMKFNDKKFEQMTHGTLDNIEIEPYKSPSGEDIQIKNTARDLGVLANNDLMFKEHINKIVTSSRIAMGMILRTFSTRDKKPMIKMFNTYIKSKLEYCCIVWSPVQQSYINELEKIQKTFTSKINGMEELDYHERLKELDMYSLERRRDRYFIIYGWQQIEGVKENVLDLKTSWIGTSRRIISKRIPYQVEGKRLRRADTTKVYNCPARKVERIFNSIPASIRNLTGVTTDTFKLHLDKWLKTVPDLPRIGKYSRWVAAESNNVQHQAVTLHRR